MVGSTDATSDIAEPSIADSRSQVCDACACENPLSASVAQRDGSLGDCVPALAITVVVPDSDDAAVASAVLAQCLAETTADVNRGRSDAYTETQRVRTPRVAMATVTVECHGRRGLRHFLQHREGVGRRENVDCDGSGGCGGESGDGDDGGGGCGGSGDGNRSSDVDGVTAALYPAATTPRAEAPPQPQAVWLGYERGRPRPSRELVDCAGWVDLNHLLASGALVPRASQRTASESDEAGDGVHSTLGVFINADRTKLCWDGAEVDWVVAGVAEAASAHNLVATPV